MTVAETKPPAVEPGGARRTDADVVIVGGGIIGLATAWKFIEQRPGTRVVVFEKEDRLAAHQSGRNSGVLHSGIYYTPGSLKATNCRRGRDMMVEFCARHGITHEVCGKVIVATEERELEALQRIHDRGIDNGIDCEMIDGDALREIEPHCAGIRAIRVGEAGIVDYVSVCEALADLIRENGGEVRTGARVLALETDETGVRVLMADDDISSSIAVNCAGLHSDRVARSSGVDPDVRILPFRGEYYMLSKEAERLVNNLIYPVPDPRYPFLGVHFTRMATGGVECGPNAVLALAREGYTWGDVNTRDLGEIFMYRGFWAFARRHWRAGIEEMQRSLSKARFLKSLQRLVPELKSQDITTGPAGVRAQAITRDGRLLDDFSIVEEGRVVHVCNAPSPAATSSLSIGAMIAEKAEAVLP